MAPQMALLICTVLSFSIGVLLASGNPNRIITAHAVQPRHMTKAQHVRSVINFWTEEKFHQAKSPWEVNPEMFNGTNASSRHVDRFKSKHHGRPRAIDPVLGQADFSRAAADHYGRPTTGKVFWSDRDNQYYVCSASVVPSKSGDLLVTAAHCIFDGHDGNFLINSNWVFIPGYNKGHRPYGTFPARMMVAYTAWPHHKDFNYDYGFVLLQQVDGRHVQDVVGSQGIGFHFGLNEMTYAFGFPHNLEHGEVMQYCSAPAGAHVNDPNYNGRRLECDMKGGASGGPWIQLYDTHRGVGYVTSVNSFIVGDEHMVYGPHFDGNVASLYDSVAKE